MGRGRPRGRKKAAKGSPPPLVVLEDPIPLPSGAAADAAVTERERIEEQQRLFSDREVQRRIAAIQAIRDAEIENLLSRLRLLRSCLSREQQKIPALQFFRENMPNLSVVKKESDGIFVLEWKDKVGNFSMNHATGRNVLASLDRDSILPSSGLGPQFSAQSIKMNFLEAASLQIPCSGLEEPSESQFLGLSDAFHTPGVTGHRLSVGTTPKTLRLPKHGEMLLSVRGSPLGVYREENLEAIHESGDGSQGASQ